MKSFEIDSEVILIVVVVCAILYMFMNNICGCQPICDNFYVGAAEGRGARMRVTMHKIDKDISEIETIHRTYPKIHRIRALLMDAKKSRKIAKKLKSI